MHYRLAVRFYEALMSTPEVELGARCMSGTCRHHAATSANHVVWSRPRTQQTHVTWRRRLGVTCYVGKKLPISATVQRAVTGHRPRLVHGGLTAVPPACYRSTRNYQWMTGRVVVSISVERRNGSVCLDSQQSTWFVAVRYFSRVLLQFVRRSTSSPSQWRESATQAYLEVIHTAGFYFKVVVIWRG